MIKTMPNGRRKSEFTLDEAVKTTSAMYLALNDDERALFDAWQRETEEKAREIEENIINHCYHTKPVSMEQFIEDPYYLGESCSTIYPQVKQDLIDLFEHSYREFVFCLHPDIVVPLMDGTESKMCDLIKRWDKEQKPVWVYSVKKDGEIVPAQAVNMRYTGDDYYYKVTLDDGSDFVCNARHRMVMRDGTKRMVMDMSIGDSIMPFVTMKSTKGTRRRIKGYELVLDLKSEDYKYTHAISANHRYGYVNPKEKTIHHVDFNKLNNDPDNLELMPWSEQRIRTIFKKEGIELKEKFPKSRNHFVVSIEKIGYGPVCCMTVPETENFAIITNRKDGKREGVFSSNTGSIGIGKSYSASIVICRILYDLSCMINPQKSLGMSSGSELTIPLIGKNLTLARQVMKTAVDDKIKESPYFMTHFSPKIASEYSLFPNNIRVTIGSYGSDRILGSNSYAAFLDECLTKKSIITIEKDNNLIYKSIGELLGMDQAGDTGYQIVCLDHENKRLKSGWWRIKESTVQPIVSIQTAKQEARFSHEHPVLVRKDDKLIYVHAKDLAPGDFIVLENNYEHRRGIGCSSRDGRKNGEKVWSQTRDMETIGRATKKDERGSAGTICEWCRESHEGENAIRGSEKENRGSFKGEEIFRRASSENRGSEQEEGIYGRKSREHESCAEESQKDERGNRKENKRGKYWSETYRRVSKKYERSSDETQGHGGRCFGRDEKKDIGCSKTEDRGEESFLRENAFGRVEEENERESFTTCCGAFRRNEKKNRGCSKRENYFRGNKNENERVCNREKCRFRVEEGTIGEDEESSCRRKDGFKESSEVWRRSSEIWNEAYQRSTQKNKRGENGDARSFTFRGVEDEDFRGECACYKGQSTEIPKFGEISLWCGYSMQDCEGGNACRTSCSFTGYKECYRGRQDELGGIYFGWGEKDDGSRFSSGEGGWGNCNGRRKGSIISLLQKGKSEIFCNVGLLQEKWIQNDISSEQSGNARCLQGTICWRRVCESGKRGANPGSPDGKRVINPVREETLLVKDLPEGLSLIEIESVEYCPPEQTYSICTEFNTFIADGIVVHNTNFPPKRKGQQIQTGFGVKKDISKFDIVEKTYRTMLRRIKSRFQRAGGIFPGMVVLCSSAATVDSFIERKLRESKNDANVFVRDHTQWTSKPKDNFSGEVFYVLCSHSSMNARILKEEEYDIISQEYLDANDLWLMDVPVEFREDFDTDLEEALRDIGGISTQALSIYIQRPQKIIDAIDKEREHPFTKYEWIAGGPGGFIWNMMVREFERRLPGGFTEKAFAPIRNPEALRWCHIDVSLSGDCTGFCVGHIERWVEVVRRGEDGAKYADVAPYYVIDIMMRIYPPPGEQIYLPDLRQLIYQMMKKGYRFLGYSSDTFQYAEMHQQLKRKGVTPHLISMDTSTEPYDELKSAFYEDRIEIYDYQPFIDEFKKLEYDRLKGKIDHTAGESKDSSDSVAGVVFGLKKSSNRMPMYTEKSNMIRKIEENAWVSPLLEANADNIELVKQAGDRTSFEIMPIMFGDDF